MSLEYLLLPRLQIQAANAQATWWLINSAPVMAANLFAHNLGRQTGKLPVGLAIVHHDAQMLGEHFWDYGKLKLHPQQRRGAVYIDSDDYSSKNKHALSLQPTASCHLTWSLLLAFDDSEGIPSLKKVAGFLAGARFAGGQIVDCAKTEVLNSHQEIRQAIRSGYWLVERQDLMATDDDSDPLDAMVRAVTQREDTSGPSVADASGDQVTLSDDEKLESEAPNDQGPPDSWGEDQAVDVGSSGPKSWIVPTTLGYAPITDFAERPGAREGYPHAYAEPLVGLVQYVSVNHYKQPKPPLWRHTWLSNDVFIVTQQEV